MRGLEARLEPAAQRAPQRLGLVGDLLAHVVVERALVEGLVLPDHRRRRLDGAGAVELARLVAVGAHDRDLAVVEMDDTGGMPHEGRRVRAEQHLLVAEAQHHRAAVARHDQHVGTLGIHDGKAIGADHQLQDRAHHGLQRRAVVHQRDQMGDHLGVGVGAEGRAPGGELRPQRGGVLDDAVVHDGVAAGAVAMGMGVAVARLAVGRPARMGDAGRALEAQRLQLIQFAHAALALGDLERAFVGDGDAGRIVAAIFQAVEPGHQDGGSLALADVADDAAHGEVPSRR